MRHAAKAISGIALATTVIPCLLYFGGWVGHSAVTSSALVGTVVWFLATPCWMGRELPIDAAQVEI
jgi:uncharacterized membrane protein YfcA